MSPNWTYTKCILAKCTRLACLLSFASLFASNSSFFPLKIIANAGLSDDVKVGLCSIYVKTIILCILEHNYERTPLSAEKEGFSSKLFSIHCSWLIPEFQFTLPVVLQGFCRERNGRRCEKWPLLRTKGCGQQMPSLAVLHLHQIAVTLLEN